VKQKWPLCCNCEHVVKGHRDGEHGWCAWPIPRTVKGYTLKKVPLFSAFEDCACFKKKPGRPDPTGTV
jgi:hypothetical protein